MQSPIPIIQNAFGKVGKPKKFTLGAHIYWEGQDIEHVYIVVNGRVKLVKVMTGAMNEFIHHFIYPNEFLGEGEFIAAKKTRQTSAIAIDKEVLVWELSFSHLFTELKMNPELAGYLMEQLVKREENAWKRYQYKRQYSSQDVLIATLVDLAIERGEEEDEVVALFGFTQKELAEYAAISRQSAVHAMNKLKKEKKIEYGQKRLFIKVKHLSHEIMLR